MGYLVGDSLLEKGDRVLIIWTNGDKTEAIYKETFGYSHILEEVNTKKEIRLSNHFMRLKFIRIKKLEEWALYIIL